LGEVGQIRFERGVGRQALGKVGQSLFIQT
jgi:hypothetical protein